ncbi:hypothetical protein BOX15_Mlig033474g1, partial [Macrostomum lignano]
SQLPKVFVAMDFAKHIKARDRKRKLEAVCRSDRRAAAAASKCMRVLQFGQAAASSSMQGAANHDEDDAGGVASSDGPAELFSSSSDCSSDRGSERGSDRISDRAPGRGSDCDSERGSDRSSDGASGRGSDRSPDPSDATSDDDGDDGALWDDVIEESADSVNGDGGAGDGAGGAGDGAGGASGAVDEGAAHGGDDGVVHIAPGFLQPVHRTMPHLSYATLAVYGELLAEKHKLSRNATADLLLYTKLALPPDAVFADNPYRLRRFLESCNSLRSERLLFCPRCSRPLVEALPLTCEPCGKQFSSVDRVAKVWRMDVRAQLRQLIERCGLLSVVSFPADVTRRPGGLSLWQSTAYSAFTHLIDKAARSDLTVTVNIDAFSVFSRAVYNICPVYLTVNEVPDHMRARFTVVCALWACRNKVSVDAFLPWLVAQLNSLRIEGVMFRTGGGRDGTRGGCIRFHPLLFVLDAPQRVEVTGLQHCSAVYGCDHCYTVTLHDADRGGNARIFPCELSADALQAASDAGCTRPRYRALQDTILLATTIPAGAGHNLGVVRLSPLHRLQGFDFITSCPPCYLHQCLVGVVGWLLRQHFLPVGKRPDKMAENPDLSRHVAEVDAKAASIRVPASHQRGPRTLADLGHFRGHEFECWLLVYGPMVLGDTLGPFYYNQLLLLSSSIFWLSLENCPLTEVTRAAKTLRVFYASLKDGFSPAAMTYNAHQVCEHLVPAAFLFGPVWRTSAGLFESLHYGLKTRVKGARFVGDQVHSAIRRQFSRRAVMHQLGLASPFAARGFLQGVQETMADGTRVYTKLHDDEFRWALLTNGWRIERYLPALQHQRSLCCFVAFAASDDGVQLAFGRVDAIRRSPTRGTAILMVRRLRTVCLLDPEYYISGVAQNDGCRLRHIQRVVDNPFGDIGGMHFCLPVVDVLGTCCVTDTHIAFLPHVQTSFAA